MSFIFNSSVNSLSGRMPVLKVDHMNQNQGRTFGPLLTLFLVNLLAKTVAAKYFSYFPFQLSHDPSPWLAYNKPAPLYNHHSYYSQWYPVKNPYHYEHYPTLTTVSPYITHDHLPPDYDHDYQEEYDYPLTTHQPKDYDRLIPAESNTVQNQEHVKRTVSLKEPTTKTSTLVATTPVTTAVTTPVTTPVATVTKTPISVTTLIQEPIAAESSFKVRRQPAQKQRRRGPSKRDKYPQRRRRPATPLPDYYDSYEDYTERYQQPNRRRKPSHQQQSAESYYDENDDYYDSFESTTRYYKKPKRRPTRKSNRNQNRNDDSFEIESSTERFNPNTEIVIVRQAATTTPGSTTTTEVGTTTEPTTIITNSTTPASTTESSNATGYGPSNGNEYVSFTYGPPVGKYQYQVPSFDWYTHEATKNAIVKKVRDIVNNDKRLSFK